MKAVVLQKAVELRHVLGGMLEGNNSSWCEFPGFSGSFRKSGHHLKVTIAAGNK